MTNAVALAIKITADGKSAAAGIDGVTRSTSKMGKAGSLAGKALAGGLLLAAGAAFKATQAAAEDEQAQVRLAGALRNATGARDKDIASVEKWITAQGRNLGIADDALRPALEKLVAATKDVAAAQDLASIAMDISARRGESLEGVSAKLAKAVSTGNVAALAKYGVETKNAEGKTKSLAKVQQELADLYSGAAVESADSAAGAQAKLGVKVDELKEKYGEKLLPVLLSVADAGLKLVDWIDKNETAAAAIVGTLGGLLAIVKLVSIATKIYTTYQTILNAVMAANPFVLIVLAIVALVAILVIAYKKSDTFKRIVDKAFRAVADAGKFMWENALKPAFEKMKAGLEAVGEAGVWLWNNALQPAFKFIIKGVATVLEIWAKMLGVLGKVPGFGWAKTAADAMGAAADKANEIADGLQKIKDKKVTVTIQYQEINRPPGTPGSGINSGVGRMAAGGRGGDTVNVTVNGFVGSEIQLVRQLEGLFARQGRRA